jgi:ribosomal protein L36
MKPDRNGKTLKIYEVYEDKGGKACIQRVSEVDENFKKKIREILGSGAMEKVDVPDNIVVTESVVEKEEGNSPITIQNNEKENVIEPDVVKNKIIEEEIDNVLKVFSEKHNTDQIHHNLINKYEEIDKFKGFNREYYNQIKEEHTILGRILTYYSTILNKIIKQDYSNNIIDYETKLLNEIFKNNYQNIINLNTELLFGLCFLYINFKDMKFDFDSILFIDIIKQTQNTNFIIELHDKNEDIKKFVNNINSVENDIYNIDKSIKRDDKIGSTINSNNKIIRRTDNLYLIQDNNNKFKLLLNPYPLPESNTPSASETDEENDTTTSELAIATAINPTNKGGGKTQKRLPKRKRSIVFSRRK